MTPKNLNFGEALKFLNEGLYLTREGWNGKGLSVHLTGGVDYGFSEIEPFFVINNARNSHNAWVPSTSDILATDWMVV